MAKEREPLVSQHLQTRMAYLSIFDDDFLSKIRLVLDPTIFTQPEAQTIIEACFSYWDLFKEAPKDHFLDTLDKHLVGASAERKTLLITYAKRIRLMKKPNPRYVLKRLSDFIRASELGQAAIKFAQHVSRGQFVEAENLMREAMRSGIRDENVGLDYLVDYQRLKTRGLADDLLMKTGVASLDKIIGGYKRSQLVCFLGGPKGKKSWGMMYLARTALLFGLNVLHITHEMTEKETEQRYDQIFGSMVASSKPKAVTFCIYDSKSKKFKTHKELRPTVYDTKEVQRVRKRVRRFGGRLIVKKYPMGTCTMAEIRRYIDYLEDFEDFRPDVVINDYADIMKGGKNEELRNQINALYIAHKGLADEKDILVVTASQAKREAIRRAVITMKDFAEDIRKAANVDLALAICQTEPQMLQQQALLYIVANRSGPQERFCRIGMQLEAGQFCLWSTTDSGEELFS